MAVFRGPKPSHTQPRPDQDPSQDLSKSGRPGHNGAMPATTRVGAILQREGSIVFPGVYDTLSAKIVERAGFPMSFISGYSVAATAIGEPDLGLLTQTEIVDQARRVCGSVKIPILVDADTGYGNPLNAIRTVTELISAGAARRFPECPRWPRKSAHI